MKNVADYDPQPRLEARRFALFAKGDLVLPRRAHYLGAAATGMIGAWEYAGEFLRGVPRGEPTSVARLLPNVALHHAPPGQGRACVGRGEVGLESQLQD